MSKLTTSTPLMLTGFLLAVASTLQSVKAEGALQDHEEIMILQDNAMLLAGMGGIAAQAVDEEEDEAEDAEDTAEDEEEESQKKKQ